MEPVKGGALANLPEVAEKVFKELQLKKTKVYKNNSIKGIYFTLKYFDEIKEKIENGEYVFDFVKKYSKNQVKIQRYKGLGEMNPEQLWDTTMDPKYRTLLKVNLDDVIEADRIFSTLMGDDVEPRREFIEENAVYVQNLDV